MNSKESQIRKRRFSFSCDERLHAALKLKAHLKRSTMSDLVNQILARQLRNMLEEIEDLAEVKSRIKDKRGALTSKQLKRKLGFK